MCVFTYTHNYHQWIEKQCGMSTARMQEGKHDCWDVVCILETIMQNTCQVSFPKGKNPRKSPQLLIQYLDTVQNTQITEPWKCKCWQTKQRTLFSNSGSKCIRLAEPQVYNQQSVLQCWNKRSYQPTVVTQLKTPVQNI